MRHQNIIELSDYEQVHAKIFMLFEHASHGSMLQVLRNKVHLREEKAVSFLVQIAKGLQHIHEKNVIYLGLAVASLALKF